MKIPLLDLKRQYQDIKTEVERAVCEVLANAQYIMGANVKAFEQEFAKYTGTEYAISVGNGTDALVIALTALGIGVGDEVITTPFTFFATAESISAVGATPVFVDIRPDTFNIDENKIEEKITNKTKAIMPVHIFGQPCEMDKINEIAKKHNLYVIEDACQAVGSKYKGQKAGALSDIACFSFFPTKNLGCAGDGGMITTNNEELAIICQALRTHGSGEIGQKAYDIICHSEHKAGDMGTVRASRSVAKAGREDDGPVPVSLKADTAPDNTIYNPLKYYNYLIGFNSRLDEVQAAILRVKLKKLDMYNKLRQEIASYYNRELAGTAYKTPVMIENTESVYHLYILQSENRVEVVQSLAERGIATGIYYPIPLHLQKVYKNLNYQVGDLPVAEHLSHRTFAVPCFPELTNEEMGYIVKALAGSKE